MKTCQESFAPSPRLRHALDILLRVAHARPGMPVTAQRLSHCQGLSLSQVEALLRCLREAALVRAYKGPGGGYCLDRPASTITVCDVYLAVQAAETTAQAPTGTSPEALRTRALAQALETAVQAQLAQTPLAALTPPEGQDDPTQQALAGLQGGAFKLGPMPARLMPQAPNSVFDLSAFMARTAQRVATA